MNKLEIKTVGDTQIVITRQFAASPEAVYRAHTDPNLIQQWCLGPEDWTMPVCVFEARVGGGMRYEWSHPDGRSFYLTGEVLELTPYSKLRHVGRWHLPDPTPDNHVENIFEARDGGTFMTLTMDLPNKQVRDSMIGSGMDHGMEDSYVRLDDLRELRQKDSSRSPLDNSLPAG
jgi:uncharacterized protein YndB with AHSA1/START domain